MSPVLLPLFRVAFTLRDAKGHARGGAAQVRAANEADASSATRALYRTSTEFTVVAVEAA